jgi:hypothetical protein
VTIDEAAITEPRRKAASRLVFSSPEPACRNPITGITDRWARAAGGKATTPTPNMIRNSRRLIRSVRRRGSISAGGRSRPSALAAFELTIWRLIGVSRSCEVLAIHGYHIELRKRRAKRQENMEMVLSLLFTELCGCCRHSPILPMSHEIPR